MADFTGYLYSFYTNKDIHQIFDELVLYFQQNFNFQVEKNNDNNEYYLFFYKDKKMLEQHYEFGYYTNKDDMGCVGIEAKTINSFNSVAELHTFENKTDFEPYDINLIFHHINYFLLVLPEPIEYSKFSKTIFQQFQQILLTA